MESLGLAGMFTCLPPVRGGAVQIPEYTAGTGHRGTVSQSDTAAGVKQGKRQSSDKEPNVLLRSKRKMSGSCSSGERGEEVKRDPAQCWSWLDGDN